MVDYKVRADDPRAADVQALLTTHLAFAHDHCSPDDVHALDTAGLSAENVSFLSIRENGVLLGFGALKQLDEHHAEIKSMHTAQAARGRGVGRAMVDRLIGIARERGCRRVSLETGSVPDFAGARALYRSAGFEECELFGDYKQCEDSVCMTLELTQD